MNVHDKESIAACVVAFTLGAATILAIDSYHEKNDDHVTWCRELLEIVDGPSNKPPTEPTEGTPDGPR
jgi:hypothetical protein